MNAEVIVVVKVKELSLTAKPGIELCCMANFMRCPDVEAAQVMGLMTPVSGLADEPLAAVSRPGDGLAVLGHILPMNSISVGDKALFQGVLAPLLV